MSRIDWGPIIEQARAFVNAQPIAPDLRDTHYHLAGRQLVPNTKNAYKYLSQLTAPMRRAGTFPDFAEDVRRIDRPLQFDDPQDAIDWLTGDGGYEPAYHLDRTAGQAESLYLVVEKNGMVPRLRYWFADLGLPVIGLRGISSATLENKVKRDIARQQRPAVCLYFGDFDPTGVFIPNDFATHTTFAKVIRLGVNEDQVERYGLLESIDPQTEKDSRTPAFIRRFGRVRQVEMNAMPFDLIEELYRDAITEFWDTSAYQRVLDEEDAHKDLIRRVFAGGERL